MESLSGVGFLFLFLGILKSIADPIAGQVKDSLSSEEMSVPQSPKILGNKTEFVTLHPGRLISILECFFQGTPTPKIIWQINGKSIQKPFEEDYVPEEGKSVLKFPQHQQIHTAAEKRTNYSCYAANFLGHTMKSFIVTESQDPPAVLPLAVTHRETPNPNPILHAK